MQDCHNKRTIPKYFENVFITPEVNLAKIFSVYFQHKGISDQDDWSSSPQGENENQY